MPRETPVERTTEHLENDTARARKEEVRFGELKQLRERNRRLGGARGKREQLGRIKQKSLILAQDERWRRA